MGQDVRAWPMLALLMLVVAVAIACVLWFMREAMRNERFAVRQKLSEAYRGQLALIQERVQEQWRREMEHLDSAEPGAALFSAAVRQHWADAIICLDEAGGVSYPQITSTERDLEANGELLALEKATNREDPQFVAALERLVARVNDYSTRRMPAPQRRFLMRELQKLQPSLDFATLPAEDLAARYLEADSVANTSRALHESRAAGIWACRSSGGRVIALFTTGNLEALLEALAHDNTTSGTARVVAIPANIEAPADALATSSLAPLTPEWRLALSLRDQAQVDGAADQRVSAYLWIGSSVIAAMTLLIFVIAHGFTRQVRLARIKNDLVATVSHELKTPLTSMRALVDTLLDSERLEEKTTREYLQLLSAENARLSRVIENFLTFSRLERNRMNFRFEPVPAAQIVQSAITAMGERCHAPDCHFTDETQADLPAVVADPNAMTTALVNLLDNAWKYTGAEKRITLRTSTRNGGVCFTVEDNGIGISERENRRIFQRFYQVDQRLSRTAEGCGLGLSIVSSIVAAHHGTVSLSSEVGRGSAFTIEIPAAVAT